MIHKNNAAAGPLTLIVRGGAPAPGGVVLAATTRAVNAVGGPQVIDFNFACSTPILQQGNRYFLELSARTSPANSYTWINSQDAGGDAAYPPGRGFHSVTGWRNYDYAFRIYMCR
jgi:hypothetical protein